MLAYRPPRSVLRLLIFLAAAFVLVVLASWRAPSVRRSVNSYLTALNCPNALALPLRETMRSPECRSLRTNPLLTVNVEICFSTTLANHGYILVTNSSSQCGAVGHERLSSNDAVNKRFLSVGPDAYSFQFDGEQRWGTELEVEYRGACTYRYHFSLLTAAPFQLRGWWTTATRRAASEMHVVKVQFDLAQPLLDPPSQMVAAPASAVDGCGHLSALATDERYWTASEIESWVALPACSTTEGVHGYYLRPHWTDTNVQRFNGYVFQPQCRWTHPIAVGDSTEDLRHGWQPRSILFLGDSHARYSYDLMTYAYNANWAAFRRVPAMKAGKKTGSVGPVNMTFVWDAVLREFEFKITCDSMAHYDTIVLGAGQHNLVKTADADHDQQYTVVKFGELMANIAARLEPAACPGRKVPRVIWIGNPARPVKLKLPPTGHPLNGPWHDARTNVRLQLFNEFGWNAFKHLPGAAHVDMFHLTVPFANDFMDSLHMVMTDAQTALVQDLHHKLQLTQPAYAHLEH